MTDPDDLQRRIEQCLAGNGFSQGELLLRRARRLAAQKGAEQEADRLLREAGHGFGARRLAAIMDHEPWLFETLL